VPHRAGFGCGGGPRARARARARWVLRWAVQPSGRPLHAQCYHCRGGRVQAGSGVLIVTHSAAASVERQADSWFSCLLNLPPPPHPLPPPKTSCTHRRLSPGRTSPAPAGTGLPQTGHCHPAASSPPPPAAPHTAGCRCSPSAGRPMAGMASCGCILTQPRDCQGSRVTADTKRVRVRRHSTTACYCHMRSAGWRRRRRETCAAPAGRCRWSAGGLAAIWSPIAGCKPQRPPPLVPPKHPHPAAPGAAQAPPPYCQPVCSDPPPWAHPSPAGSCHTPAGSLGELPGS